ETLGTRLLVAGIFIPLILVITLKGGWAFVVLIMIIVGIATAEFYALARRKGTSPQAAVGIGAGLAVPVLLFRAGVQPLWLLLAALTLITACVELFRNRGSSTLNLGATLCGLLVVPVLLGHLILIRELPVAAARPYHQGGRWIVLMLLTVWVCDTAAYALGTAFGKHKLFPRISPNKTWEGAMAGFVAALLCAWGCHVLFVAGLRLVDSLAIGALCGTAGQLSDLVESQFKRDAGVKDSSTLIPGHGGMLDRFDSFIILAPLAYYYLRFVAIV
ncbi:MAG: phosphatidate cytidylyltransferase, partial [Candidatus Oleimicrobiaceae bacterium]